MIRHYVACFLVVALLTILTTLTGVPWWWCVLALVIGACLVEVLRAERERCVDCGIVLGDARDGEVGGAAADQDNQHDEQREQ